MPGINLRKCCCGPRPCEDSTGDITVTLADVELATLCTACTTAINASMWVTGNVDKSLTLVSKCSCGWSGHTATTTTIYLDENDAGCAAANVTRANDDLWVYLMSSGANLWDVWAFLSGDPTNFSAYYPWLVFRREGFSWDFRNPITIANGLTTWGCTYSPRYMDFCGGLFDSGFMGDARQPGKNGTLTLTPPP